MMVQGMLLVVASAWAGGDKTEIYVTRHADDQVQLVDLGGGLFQQDCTASGCCIETRNPLGVERSERLADWFAERNITERLDEVIATHKSRTADTVRRIAEDAGLDLVDTWADQVPGDGVHNVPAAPPECGDPAYEGATSSAAPTIAYLQALPAGRTVLVAAHSTTVTQIMTAFGIAVTDPVLFPGTPTRISGFDNLWKIEVDEDGDAVLADHWVLSFDLDQTAHQGADDDDSDSDDDSDDDSDSD